MHSRHEQISGTYFLTLLLKMSTDSEDFMFSGINSQIFAQINCRFTSELNSINAGFLKLDTTSYTIDKIFTESKDFIHNFCRDAHFNFADFYRKVL